MREVRGDPQRGRAFAKGRARKRVDISDVRIRFRLGIEGKGCSFAPSRRTTIVPPHRRTLTEGSSHLCR